MRDDPQIIPYKNGVLIRLKDRRTFVRKRVFEDGSYGWVLYSRRIIHGRYWRAVKTKRSRFDIVETAICYSHEAMSGIVQAIEYIQTHPNEFTSLGPVKNKRK